MTRFNDPEELTPADTREAKLIRRVVSEEIAKLEGRLVQTLEVFLERVGAAQIVDNIRRMHAQVEDSAIAELRRDLTDISHRLAVVEARTRDTDPAPAMDAE